MSAFFTMCKFFFQRYRITTILFRYTRTSFLLLRVFYRKGYPFIVKILQRTRWLNSVNCKRPLLIGLNKIWINLNDKWKLQVKYITSIYFIYIKTFVVSFNPLSLPFKLKISCRESFSRSLAFLASMLSLYSSYGIVNRVLQFVRYYALLLCTL